MTFRVGPDGAKWRRLRGERLEVGRDGRPRLLGVISDITDLKQAEELVRAGERLRRDSRYTEALAALYDEVYEFDWAAQTVTIRYSHLAHGKQKNVPMPLGPVLEHWFSHVPDAAEAAALRAVVENRAAELAAGPKVIRYGAQMPDGALRPLSAVFLPLDDAHCLLCSAPAKRSPD